MNKLFNDNKIQFFTGFLGSLILSVAVVMVFWNSVKTTAIEDNEFDIVISDLMFPDEEDGLKVIKCARSQWYEPAIIAMTAFDTVENAVRTMQAGADDFTSKGFGLDEIQIRIENVIQKKKEFLRLTLENKILKQTVKEQFSDYQIIGASPQINQLLQKMVNQLQD